MNNIYIVHGNIPICLVKFERNFIKCNFYFETEGVFNFTFFVHGPPLGIPSNLFTINVSILMVYLLVKSSIYGKLFYYCGLSYLSYMLL